MKLTEIIPPPSHPDYNGRPEDWELIERILQMKLPRDYKELVNIYGTGLFLDFIYLFTPFAPLTTAFSLFAVRAGTLLSHYDESQKKFPEYTAPFPATALFPWAKTSNGDTLFWLKNGNPNEWTVVICDSKFSTGYDQYQFNATDFLYLLMLSKVKSQVFPDDILSSRPNFKPYSRI